MKSSKFTVRKNTVVVLNGNRKLKFNVGDTLELKEEKETFVSLKKRIKELENMLKLPSVEIETTERCFGRMSGKPSACGCGDCG